ncbi:MAG: LytTR family transcriptional regulator DNA-binding domain-containing protein [Clostridia bacterium]|nr:LytTR family transcriptional regulator DNA-binding domain-containing protein [Clostridia bacterium]MBQ3057613.1 LytTR family transcriptional regulator DNA-binding domain-containing protein [Clostridia bacterium]
MRIAICGDECSSAIILKRMLYMFSNYKKIGFVVDIFANANDFLASKQSYTLIFISFETEKSKILAKSLLDKNLKTPIIIFSSNCCHAADAFKLNAYYFLQIPLSQKTVFDMLENFFVSYFSAPLLISDGFETVCINVSDILYLEANNKHCIIHLKDKIIYCNKTMARVFAVLPEDRFLKINRAIIINSDYISRFCSEYIILTNGEVLYPSRHFYKSFKLEYHRIKTPKIP